MVGGFLNTAGLKKKKDPTPVMVFITHCCVFLSLCQFEFSYGNIVWGKYTFLHMTDALIHYLLE